MSRPLKRLDLDADHHVLEIGCGAGLFLRELETMVQRVVGTDISQRLLSSYTGNAELIFMRSSRTKHLRNLPLIVSLMFSVALQFPSFEYFQTVIGSVMPLLKDDGIFLVGDVLFGGKQNNSKYMIYDKSEMIKFLDSMGYPYSILCQSKDKRKINSRHDILIYKD